MALKDTLSRIFRGRGRGKKPAQQPRKRSFRPLIEHLEERWAPSASTLPAPAPSAGVISGVVTNNGQSVPGVEITLTGMTSSGTAVKVSTSTDASGDYSFLQVQAGTYSLTNGTDLYVGGTGTLGSLGGKAASTTISTITLQPGQVAANYDFSVDFLAARSLSLQDFLSTASDDLFTNVSPAGAGTAMADGSAQPSSAANFTTSSTTAAALSGTVENSTSSAGISGVVVALTGIESTGDSVFQTTTTDSSGNYTFTLTEPGTYSVQVVGPVSGFRALKAAIPTGASSAGGLSLLNSEIYDIVVPAGSTTTSTGYVFEELPNPTPATPTNATGPVVTAELADDTAGPGGTDSDNITADPSIQGTVAKGTDNSAIKSLFVSVNGSAKVEITGSINDGVFYLNEGMLKQVGGTGADALKPGSNTITLEAVDALGKSNIATVTFTLQTAAPAVPTLTIDPTTLGSLGPIVDAVGGVILTNAGAATSGTVTLDGTTTAGDVVQLFEGTSIAALATETANASGDVVFSSVSLSAGVNNFVARAEDSAGNVSQLSTFVVLNQAPVAANNTSDTNVTASTGTSTAVVSASVTNGGSGYTKAPTVTFSGGIPSGATGTQATATATIANGVVTGITITSGGSGYTSLPTITLTGGGGTHAAATAALNTTVLNLADGFTDPNGGNTIVQLNTSAGPVYLEMFDSATPQTVANFLAYINSGAYNDAVLNRLVPDFVLQGGNYTLQSDPTSLKLTTPISTIGSEQSLSSNTTNKDFAGTLSMALTQPNGTYDENSASDQFFFNLSNNSTGSSNNLDPNFTVFAQVLSGSDMRVLNTLATAPVHDESSYKGDLGSLPLNNFSGSSFPADATASNFELIDSAAVVSQPDSLTYTVTNVSDPSGVLSSETPTVNSNGTITLGYLSNKTGIVTLTVTATDLAGQSTTQTFTVTVGTGTTTTAATTATTGFSTSSQTVTLTGNVTATSGTVNAGTFTFTVAGLGSVTSGTVTNGTASASFTVPAGTTPQSLTITTAYSGGGQFAASSNASGSLVVTSASTTTKPTLAAATLSANSQVVTLTGNVTSAGGPVTGGTFTFTVGSFGTVTSGTIANGTANASFTLPANTPLQSIVITTAFSGVTDFAASSNNAGSLVVGNSTTTSPTSATTTFSSSSQSVTLTGHVSGSTTVDAGTFTFTVGNLGSVTSGTVSGGAASASFTVPAGTNVQSLTITTNYNGGTDGTNFFGPSSDATGSLSVTKVGTTTQPTTAVVTTSGTSQVVSLTGNVTSSGGPVTGGTLTFTVAGFSPVVSGTVANGTASANFTVPAGTSVESLVITTAYSGSTDFSGSSDNTGSLVIGAATVTSPTTATTAFSSSSQSVTLTGNVTSGAGTVDVGTFTFTVAGFGSVTSGTVTGGTASASFTVPAGTNPESLTITTVYSGGDDGSGGRFGPSSDATGSLSITKVNTTAQPTTAIVTTNSALQVVTLTGNVTSSGGSVNGGTITFTVAGFSPVVSGTVTNGTATANFTVPAGTAVKSLAITTAYSGSTDFASSSDSTGSLIVGAASVTAPTTATAIFSSSSQNVTLTGHVTSTAGTVDTGTFTFTVAGLGSVTSSTVTGGTANASFTVPAGTNPASLKITTAYSGGNDGSGGLFGPSSDATGSLSITKAATSTSPTTATASANDASSQLLTLTGNVSSGAGTVNGGTISFTVGNLGTVTSGTVAGGTANANFTLPANTTAQSFTITTAYNSGTDFAGSSDNTGSLTVS